MSTAPRTANGSGHEPMVVVCAGGGGVGKTTTSAALALSLARAGRSTLIVTIDPARRLAGAMGVPITDVVSRVSLPAAHGRLWALMPDPRRSLRTFIDNLFEDEPAARDRVLANRLYVGLADAAAGVHELVAMNLVAHAASRGEFEVVVIDTAPSRHAIDFVTYPARLAALLGGRTVTWLAGLAARGGATDGAPAPTGGLLSWGAGHVESVIGRVTGPTLMRDTASLFGDLAVVRERFVQLSRRASELLLGEGAAYALVAAPTAAARDDVVYLAKRLEKLGRTPRAIVMNRADLRSSAYLQVLRDARALPYALPYAVPYAVPEALGEAVAMLQGESESRAAAADRFSAELRKRMPAMSLVRLPTIEATTPAAIVSALSDELDAYLEVLLPPRARS